MKSLTMFSGDLHLLHYYESNLALILAFKNLFIGFLMLKDEQKIVKNEWLDT